MPTQHIPTLLQLSIYTLYICIVARYDAGTIIMSNRIALPQERIHLAYAHCCIIAILVYTRSNHNKTAVIFRVNTLLIAHARFGGVSTPTDPLANIAWTTAFTFRCH